MQRTFFLISLVVFADYAIGQILRKFYFSQKAGTSYRTTYAMDSTTADILIFGSSRANHHYIPEVFEKGFSMSFYNTGRDGSSIFYNYSVLRAILKRYTPKIIILDIRPIDCFYNVSKYESLSSLIPYYSDHPEIREIISLRSPFEKIKLLSSIYPFNSLLLTIVIGNLEINKKRKPDNKGYIPLYGKMENGELMQYNNTGMIDNKVIQAVDSFSMLCYNKGIRLFICYSPFYYQMSKTEVDTLLSNICNKYHFKYINFSNEPAIIARPELFQDKSHLNNKGAFEFSLRLVDTLSCNRDSIYQASIHEEANYGNY